MRINPPAPAQHVPSPHVHPDTSKKEGEVSRRSLASLAALHHCFPEASPRISFIELSIFHVHTLGIYEGKAMSLQQPSRMQLSSVQSKGCSWLWRGDRHCSSLKEITGHLDWKRMSHYARPGCIPELPLGRDLQNSQGWLRAQLCRRALPAPPRLKWSLRSSLRCSAGTLGGRASLLLSPGPLQPMKHSSFQTHDRTIPVLPHPRTPHGLCAAFLHLFLPSLCCLCPFLVFNNAGFPPPLPQTHLPRRRPAPEPRN